MSTINAIDLIGLGVPPQVAEYLEVHTTTTPGNIDPIPAGTVIANVLGATLSPTAAPVSSVLDVMTSTRGSLLYRGASGWAGLSPGTSGRVLQANGTGADPSWAPTTTGSGVGANYATVSDLQAANVDLGLTTLTIAGHNEPGVGFMIVDEVDDDGGYPGFYQSNDGRWWKLRNGSCSPEQFGAYGDWKLPYWNGSEYIIPSNAGSHDDTQAWNDLMEYGRNQATVSLSFATLGYGFYGTPQFSIVCREGAVYKTSASINATGFRYEGLSVFGNGAIVYPIMASANQTVFDWTNSRGVWPKQLILFSDDPTLTGGFVPNYGWVISRCSSEDISGWHFTDVMIRGFYANSCFLNVSGEIIEYDHFTCVNYMLSTIGAGTGRCYTGNCIQMSDEDVPTFTSPFVTYTARSYFGYGNNLFTQCHFQNALGIPLALYGTSATMRFENSYVYGGDNMPCALVDGRHIGMDLDIHFEGNNSASYSVMFNNKTAVVQINSFSIAEQGNPLTGTDGMMQCADPSSGFPVLLINASVTVMIAVGAPGPRIFGQSDWCHYLGDMEFGTELASYVDMDAFLSYKGRITTGATYAAMTNLPSSGYIWYESGVEDYPTLYGASGVALKTVGTIIT